MLAVNYVETEEEANDWDLFFVFYDFTGKVIPDENFLENDNISIIFTLCGDVDEEFIRRLTEEYEEAETEEKKLEILGEIQNIMAFYVIKINHIDKYYLADPEYFEFTNGHPANLVYWFSVIGDCVLAGLNTIIFRVIKKYDFVYKNYLAGHSNVVNKIKIWYLAGVIEANFMNILLL